MHEIFELQPEFSNHELFLQGERTPLDYPENRARWEITLGGTLQQRGFVLARQLQDGTTNLQFAYYSNKFQPIGPKFDIEFANYILGQSPLGGIDSLKRNLAQHNSNLQKLEEQAAMYGAGEHPLHLLNQIEIEQKTIVELEDKIRTITASTS